MSIVETIESLRSVGWTDNAIGQALHLDRTSIWRYRTGRVTPIVPIQRSLNNLKDLDDLALGVNTGEGHEQSGEDRILADFFGIDDQSDRRDSDDALVALGVQGR